MRDGNMFIRDASGRFLVSKKALIDSGVYSDASYRKNKSINRFQEIQASGSRYALLESIPAETRKLAVQKLGFLMDGYKQLLDVMNSSGVSCTDVAIENTAQSLEISEPFITSELIGYMKSHYHAYTFHYLDAGIHSASVIGYSKQRTLLEL